MGGMVLPQNFLLPAITLLLLPQVTFAGWKESECLRACRSCSRPKSTNVSVNCPAVGFDCDLTDPSSYDFEIDSGESGKDCLSLTCGGGGSLIVRGEAQPYLACFEGRWRVPGKDEEFRTSTKSAVCLRKCNEGACKTALTAKYKAYRFIEATISAPNEVNSCATATCPDDFFLYGGFRNNSEDPVLVSDALSCTGNGQWKDVSGRRFDFPACIHRVCPPFPYITQQQLDTFTEVAYTVHSYPESVTYRRYPALHCPSGRYTVYWNGNEIFYAGNDPAVPTKAYQTCESGLWYYNEGTDHYYLAPNLSIGCATIKEA